MTKKIVAKFFYLLSFALMVSGAATVFAKISDSCGVLAFLCGVAMFLGTHVFVQINK
jgi:hypothetical protein